MAKETIENIARESFKEFGISKPLTTYEHVKWLDTKKGERYLESIEVPNGNLGSYWTVHEAKSNIITKYAHFRGT